MEDRLATEFRATLNFAGIHFPNGFRRSPKHMTVPRIRFEAISVGITLALRLNATLDPSPVSAWLNSTEFQLLTRSDASNSRPRVVNRIHFVRDSLLGRPIEYDGGSQPPNASAAAEAPEIDEKQFSLL